MLLKQKILFNENECNDIINLIKINNQSWKTYDRKYLSEAIDYTIETNWIFDKLKFFFESETNIKITNIKTQIHFHKFITGDWFGKHNDVKYGRKYAVGVLLNNDFEGGDFKLYNPSEFNLLKEIGNTYIFDVRIDHEIKPITNGERYSLLWFLQSENIKNTPDKLV